MKLQLSLATAILCFVSAAFSEQALASPEAPNVKELQRGWKMSAAKTVSGDEALVSQAGFDASKWYDIQRMPATVLQALEDNGGLQGRYQGMNRPPLEISGSKTGVTAPRSPRQRDRPCIP
jgi:hypothetical protein